MMNKDKQPIIGSSSSDNKEDMKKPLLLSSDTSSSSPSVLDQGCNKSLLRKLFENEFGVRHDTDHHSDHGGGLENSDHLSSGESNTSSSWGRNVGSWLFDTCQKSIHLVQNWLFNNHPDSVIPQANNNGMLPQLDTDAAVVQDDHGGVPPTDDEGLLIFPMPTIVIMVIVMVICFLVVGALLLWFLD